MNISNASDLGLVQQSHFYLTSAPKRPLKLSAIKGLDQSIWPHRTPQGFAEALLLHRTNAAKAPWVHKPDTLSIIQP